MISRDITCHLAHDLMYRIWGHHASVIRMGKLHFPSAFSLKMSITSLISHSKVVVPLEEQVEVSGQDHWPGFREHHLHQALNWFTVTHIRIALDNALVSDYIKSGLRSGIPVSNSTWISTMQSRCNAINFLPNPPKRHPTARPWGWGMGCLLGDQPLISVPIAAVPYIIQR